jgi:predicted ATPase/DNA-binding CsgD family transcriptional regulator
MDGRVVQDLPLAQPLTSREKEILTLIGNGMTNRQIAGELSIAMSTVKWYVRQIYSKLGVENRAEAVARARSLGLLEQEGAIRHNLPLAATPFVGREAELAALADLIADPQVRIITILGPGGIGKTRLALEAAGRELHPQSSFPDGIFFISLAPLESADEITPTLAVALDFHFQDGENETEQLLAYLRRKQMLLVMDNFEQILDGQSFLARLSQRAPGINLLVTSRERLQLRGEQLFPLYGLEMPESGDSVEDAPAGQLFLHIARRTTPDFQLLEGDAASLLRIWRLVEGMPLGLELAASWAGVLPLSEIAAEIEQGLQVLSSTQHDAPPRHQSMQAALDASWARLNEDQQRALQELSVFRGGFRRAAALEIAGASLPILVTLINKSWLSYDRQTDRYHIHELLRQYSAGKLGAEPVHEQLVRDRHSAYFCGLLQAREADWFGPRQQDAFAEVRNEIDNVQRAWQRVTSMGNCALLAQGLHGLCHFYEWEGRKADGQKACRAAAEGLAAVIAGEQAGGALRHAVWSRVLAWESNFVEEVVEREKLLLQSQQVLERAGQLGWDTRAEEALIYLHRAYATGNKDRDLAIQASKRAQELFREVGDLRGQAEASRNIGVNYLFLGAFQEAIDRLRESLTIRQELEDWRGIAQTTIDLGIAAQHQGNYKEAETLHLQALLLSRHLQNQQLESYTLTVLSFTQSWAGNFTLASESAQQALEQHREISDEPELWSLIAFTLAGFHLGNYADTALMATEALEMARQRGHLLEKALALMLLGGIAFVEGDLATAVDHLSESASLMEKLGYVYQALPRAILCLIARTQGDGEKARAYLESALRSGIAYRSTTPIMHCLPAAALLAADGGSYERSTELYGLAQQFGHIRNSCWFGDMACKELERVRASLPPDLASVAEARGREADVWETAEALLLELDSR